MEKSRDSSYGQGKHYDLGKNWSVQGCDYRIYSLKKVEYIQYTIIWMGLVILFSYTFYHSFLIAVVGLLALPFYFRITAKKLKKRRQSELRSQFKDAIQFMEGYLRSGYSVENAMERCKEDIVRMSGKTSDMGLELYQMTSLIHLNVPVEEVWEAFAQRSGVFQIEQFACIFRIAKRSGGNVSAVIRSSMIQIAEQIRAEEEIRTILASRMFQMKVMNFVPIGVLLYVGTASPELLEVMYATMIGRLVMTGCLVVYILAYCLGVYMMQSIHQD